MTHSPFRRLMDFRRSRNGSATYGCVRMEREVSAKRGLDAHLSPEQAQWSRIIGRERHELRHGPHSMVSYRIALGNLALRSRGIPMRAWTYEQVCGPHHSVCARVGLRKVDEAAAAARARAAVTPLCRQTAAQAA